MIVHINHISQTKKKTGKPSQLGELASLVTGSLVNFVEDGVLDASVAPSLRIHLDWIQYRTNFRDPVIVRRTTDPRVLLMEGLLLYGCFLFFARGAGTFLLEEWALLRLAVPVVVALWVLVLVDAYAAGPKRSPLYPVRDAVIGLMVAGLTWSVPVRVMLMGGGMSVLLVSALRMLFPPDENRPRGAT